MLLVLFGSASSILDEAIPMSTHNNNFRGELRRKQQPGNSLSRDTFIFIENDTCIFSQRRCNYFIIGDLKVTFITSVGFDIVIPTPRLHALWKHKLLKVSNIN